MKEDRVVLALWPGIAVDMETHMKQLVSKCSRAIRIEELDRTTDVVFFPKDIA